MNLLIDSGNTFTKIALSEGDSIVKISKISNLQEFVTINREYSPSTVIVSSVNKDAGAILQLFPKAHTILLDHTTPIPIKNLYKTPATLGMDRLAAAVGAHERYPKSPVLCIDAGTCITYDFIDANAHYLGGGIAPGVEMRFRALHTLTAKLPLIERKDTVELIGNTTENSILSGVQIGVIKEVEGIISEYKVKYAGLKILITGGDHGFFESRIKDTIFAVPDLLFLGLKRIVAYNVS